MIAVEETKKMEFVACQARKQNNMLKEESENDKNQNSHGVITVVHNMIEDIEICMAIEIQSVDGIVSEWMG